MHVLNHIRDSQKNHRELGEEILNKRLANTLLNFKKKKNIDSLNDKSVELTLILYKVLQLIIKKMVCEHLKNKLVITRTSMDSSKTSHIKQTSFPFLTPKLDWQTR